MKNTLIRKLIATTVIGTLAVTGFTACAAGADESSAGETGSGETVVLRGIVDLVPHSEIIEHVAPQLEEQGIHIELVSTAADATTNERLAAG